MMRLNRSFAWLLAVALTAGSASGQDTARPVRLGVLAYGGAEKARLAWELTADYLTKEIPGYSFRIVPEPKHETYSARPSTRPSTGLTTCVA